MMDDLRLSEFPIYHAFDDILGHISLSVELCISSWSHMILITHKTHVELIVYYYLIMIPQWSLSWAIQLGSHFRHLDIITPLLLGDVSLIRGSDLVVDMDDWDCTFDDG